MQLLLQNQKIELAVSELSIAAKVFDPLGLLEPFTVKAKMMLQELWKQKVSWDSQLPDKRRPVSSVGRAPDCRAGGRRFKPRPDHSQGLKITEEKVLPL